MADRDLCCETSLVHEDSVKKVRADMLPEADIAAISEIFKIIGDPTRARIVWALDRYELCVCDLAAALDMTKSAISHQLSTLKQYRVVKARRDGKNVYYSLDDQHVTDMFEIAIAHIKHRDGELRG